VEGEGVREFYSYCFLNNGDEVFHISLKATIVHIPSFQELSEYFLEKKNPGIFDP
jgi:hypothetical protein